MPLTPPAPALGCECRQAGPGRTGPGGARSREAQRGPAPRGRRARGSLLPGVLRPGSEVRREPSLPASGPPPWPPPAAVSTRTCAGLPAGLPTRHRRARAQAGERGRWELWKSKAHQTHTQVSVKVSSKGMEMEIADEPIVNLGQTLEWLRKELSEMRVQDQRPLLTLRHLHSILEELRTESTHWEDAWPSGTPSPIRARAGSEGRNHQPPSLERLAQLLLREDSRRSSLP
ncbi:PREDICTED: uncharacterized protein C20orf202 homolog [Chrysochloris asiatica]|uniref:Uncharacterized protein C20orf202 homolog n=1 Tax=Chrysochloris asiatica TaxID=185453 RepID=A0A9B0T993_CHRAS|nr:PREDICTED: uncharacterized protein C20orf202 homolog [Chrysochloris asiatica]